jgi:PIN domain nuclease of toxin-antitoxin system
VIEIVASLAAEPGRVFGEQHPVKGGIEVREYSVPCRQNCKGVFRKISAVNLLLDTHTLIWTLADNPELSAVACEAIVDPDNIVYVSAVSVWEISIKTALGKLEVPDTLLEEIERHRLTPLGIAFGHADCAGRLPPIHLDPFDRMLIAQAQFEQLTLVTRDSEVQKYAVHCLVA